MEVVKSLNTGTQLICTGKKQVIYDNIEGISCAIPETLDLGTVHVELTCIAATSTYIVFGTGCGALFVHNKKHGKLARPLRTNSFEAVTCIHHCTLVDDYIVAGHNTGTLIAIRLPNGREGSSTSFSQCVDTDSHRRSPVTCVKLSSDAKKVVSGDVSGIVILSTVVFDTGEFLHCFLFEAPHSIVALDFCAESVIIHNSSQLVLVNTRSPMDTQVMNDKEEKTMVIGMRSTASFLYVAKKSQICKYLTSLQRCSVIAANAVVGETGSFVSVEWNLHATKLAALSSSNSFVMFDLISLEVLWKAPLNDYICCFVGDFCVDDDDSILYITKPRGFHRVGVTINSIFIAKEETDSPVASLLFSPKKLLSSSGLHMGRGVSFFNNAINVARGITTTSHISSPIQDAVTKLNLMENPEHTHGLMKNTVGCEDMPPSDGHIPSRVGRPVIEEHRDIFVEHKEKVHCEKRSRRNPNVCEFREIDDRMTIDEESILALRKEVLGNTILSNSPCGSGLGGESTQTLSSRESPAVSDIYSRTSDGTRTSSTPSSRESSTTGKREILPQDEKIDQISKCKGEELLDVPKSVEEAINIETSRGAESVASAYEYLLQNSSTDLAASELKSSASNNSSALVRSEIVRERSRKNVVFNDQVDIWLKVLLPYTTKSFAVGSQHIVLCHRKKAPRILALDELGSKKPPWLTAKWAADYVSMNDKESIIWKVHNDVGWRAIDSLTAYTRFEECATDGGGVSEMSVGSNMAWYLTREGVKVSLQMELPEKAIFSSVGSEWLLRSISVSDEAVWAIRDDVGTLVVRVGLAKCKMGLDWIEIVPEGPSKLVSVCVYRSYGFALDDKGQLWMSTGVDNCHPFGSTDAFYKVCLPSLDPRTAPFPVWSVRAASTGLFLCAGKVMYVVRSALSGHRFPREVPNKFDILDNFSVLSAGSYVGSSGYIHLCRQDSEVFVYRPTRRNFITITVPTSSQAIVSLCGTPGNLYLTDSSGKVFHCDGESSNWVLEVNLPDCVCSIAQSKLSSWALTCAGVLLIKQHGSTVWKNVPSPTDVESDVIPTQVYTSPNGIYVWVLAGGRGWARTNISERNPAGSKWTQTYHTSELCSLAVGDNVVWALEISGQLLRLRGLAASNPAGNYWRPISQTAFRGISVDAQSELWAIDTENRLVRHMSDVYVPEKLPANDAQVPFELI